MSSQPKNNSQTPKPQQRTDTASSKTQKVTSEALAAYNQANDTPAMVRAERMKRFNSDKDTYARSVSPYNEGVEKPDGKVEKPDGKVEKSVGKGEESDGKTHS